MEVNADFSRRAVVHAAALDRVASPMAGVERKKLDRIGDEVARATFIIRYAPASRFPAYVHGGGEEFLVLDGVFEGEHGDYPVGRQVRNPPQWKHTPGSAEGCSILVELWQVDPYRQMPVWLDTRHLAFAPVAGLPPGARRSASPATPKSAWRSASSG